MDAVEAIGKRISIHFGGILLWVFLGGMKMLSHIQKTLRKKVKIRVPV